jgi:putative DNA primase/helicase
MLIDDREAKEKKERAQKAIDNTLDGCKRINEVPAVWKYLTEVRGIPEKYLLAAGDLLAHPGLDYYHKQSKDVPGQVLGNFPALVAVCRSLSGEIITLHRTYLTPDGRKLALPDPKEDGLQLPARKLMTPIDDRRYAIALYQPINDRLGVAEGIETAISAAILNDLPCHSAIDSGKLIHFTPPPGVKTLFVFADDDPAGRHGAESLRARLKIERPDLQTAIYYPRQMGGKPKMDWDDLRRAGGYIAPSRPVRKLHA